MDDPHPTTPRLDYEPAHRAPKPPPSRGWSWHLVALFASKFAHAVAFDGGHAQFGSHWLPGERATVLVYLWIAFLALIGSLWFIVTSFRTHPTFRLRLTIPTLLAAASTYLIATSLYAAAHSR